MYTFLLNHFDLPVLHIINGLCGNSSILDRLVSHLALDFKWAVPLCAFWVLWFQPHPNQVERRKILLVMIIAVLLSLVINRAFRWRCPTGCAQWRPQTSATGRRCSSILSICSILKSGAASRATRRRSSSPSQRASASSRRGLASRCLPNNAHRVVPRLSRTHFPSDVLAGALLGIAVQLAINRDYARRAVSPSWWRNQSLPISTPSSLHLARDGHGLHERARHRAFIAEFDPRKLKRLRQQGAAVPLGGEKEEIIDVALFLAASAIA